MPPVLFGDVLECLELPGGHLIDVSVNIQNDTIDPDNPAICEYRPRTAYDMRSDTGGDQYVGQVAFELAPMRNMQESHRCQ